MTSSKVALLQNELKVSLGNSVRLSQDKKCFERVQI